MLLADLADGLLTVTLFSSGVNIPRLSQPLAEIKAVSIARWRNVRAADSPAQERFSRHRVPPGVDHAALTGIDQQQVISKSLVTTGGSFRSRIAAPARVCRPSIQIDATVFSDMTRRQRADRLFLLTLQRAFHQMTGFRGQPADGAYAARDADQQALLLQFTDVPTDGHMGHAEDLRQLVNAAPRCSTRAKIR